MIDDLIQNNHKRKTQFNILLVEDNATDALLVQSHIEKTADFRLQVVEELSKAIECIDAHSFDLILLDLNLPDAIGLEGLVKLRRHVQRIPIVVLTVIANEEVGIMALQRGAQDYLVKGVDNDRLVRSIRYAIERMLLHGSDGSTKNLDYLDSNKTQPDASAISVTESDRKIKQREVLTERELQVLKLLEKGCNNQEIAERLVVSVATVKTHIGHILQKLSVSDRAKAVIEAQQQGLI